MMYQENERNVLENIESDQVQKCIAEGIMDIYIGRSLYIHLRPSKINLKNEIDLRMAISSVREKLLKFGFPVKKYVNVEVFKRDPTSSFDEFCENPVSAVESTPHGSSNCNRCLQKTILEQERYVLGQIETDIIHLTFQRLQNVSKFIEKLCLYKGRPREQRAKYFLHYVLQNKIALQNFYYVCKERKIVSGDLAKCDICESEVAGYDHLILPSKETREPYARFTIEPDLTSNGDLATKDCISQALHDKSGEKMVHLILTSNNLV